MILLFHLHYITSMYMLISLCTRAGSYLQLTSPALEFVKSTMHVLSLDGSLEEEIGGLRRMLLAQLRVREFNPESQFRDPCMSYVLSDVICTFCSSCRYVCICMYVCMYMCGVELFQPLHQSIVRYH